MREPLVSIIIPAWNAERYVREAVDSALRQTYAKCEVIVVDDGSTDATRALLEPYIEARKIMLISQSNKGLAGARNTGIRAAQGEYIALLDSDDIFLPEKVARQVAVLESHPEYEVCYSDLIHFTDTEPREYYRYRYQYPSGDILEPLLHTQFLNPLTVVARKSVFARCGYFDEDLRRSEDWDMWLRFAHKGVKFFYINEPLAQYRVRLEGNLSSLASEPAMKEKNLFLFERFGKSLSKEEWERYGFADILKRLRMKLVLAYCMVGDKSRALTASEGLPSAFRTLVKVAPAKLAEWGLRLVRRVKHRLLLKKLPQ